MLLIKEFLFVSLNHPLEDFKSNNSIFNKVLESLTFISHVASLGSILYVIYKSYDFVERFIITMITHKNNRNFIFSEDILHTRNTSKIFILEKENKLSLARAEKKNIPEKIEICF